MRRSDSPRVGEVAVNASVGAVLANAAAALATAGFDEARRRARRLIAVALDLSPSDIIAYPERVLDAAERARIEPLLARLVAREPLSRIVGKREFWGLEFGLSTDTLDPRPETETIVEAVLKRLPESAAALRLLDLGTGTGCLLLALLSEFPNATGLGVDIAVGAARTARRNACALGFAERACFVVCDWGTALTGGFDAIVANPPYIAACALADLPPEIFAYDPHRALNGGQDGLAAYRAIAVDLPRLMAPGGIFVAEIGQGQADGVAAILAERGLAVHDVALDLAGIPRCVMARRRDAIAPAQRKNDWNARRSRLGC